jgi:predicted nucleic acid-binding protein
MPFVVDASIVAAWALRDEESSRAAEALERLRSEPAFAPALLFFEVRDVLLVNERRGRLSEGQSTEFLRALSRLPIRIDRSPDETQLMTLARRHRLIVYDAAYLELALRERLPLATLDARLEAAMREAETGPPRV